VSGSRGEELLGSMGVPVSEKMGKTLQPNGYKTKRGRGKNAAWASEKSEKGSPGRLVAKEGRKGGGGLIAAQSKTPGGAQGRIGLPT